MQENQLTYKGKRLFYRKTGSGPVVILLHGFGENSNIWHQQYSALQECTLIIPDIPGSGYSEETEDMSMEGLAEAIHEIAQKEAAGKPILSLIGHSMGGYIMLAYVEKYASELKSFGLFHSTAYEDSPEKKETRQKGIEFIQKNGADPFLRISVPNLYYSDQEGVSKQRIEEHLASVRNFSASALVSYYRSMIMRPDRTAILKHSELPVLFVLGRHDTAVPLNDGLKQSHLPLLSYIHILDKSGHMGMIEEPELTNEILNDFIRDIEMFG
jgi:pimeloyl-ACP methyl ester carboxylesterase